MAEREIKYRGLKTFQIFSGETKNIWIYGFYLKRGTYGDPGPQAHIFVYENGYEGYRVEATTIGQFTGLLDSEGKEIYEDDIISFYDGKIGLVEFFHGCFVVRYGKDDAFQPLYDINDWKIKILGNRFENPELLLENFSGRKKVKNVKSVRNVKKKSVKVEPVAYQGSE